MNMRVADWRARSVSSGVGAGERVPRPAREAGRRVVMESGFKTG